MTFKVLFWFYVIYLSISGFVRLHLYVKDRFWQTSVLFEWLLAVVCTVGIYAVAYNKKILFPIFWGTLGILAFATTIYRITGSYLANTLPELTYKQTVATKLVMALWAAPLVLTLFVNAFNLTNLWSACKRQSKSVLAESHIPW